MSLLQWFETLAYLMTSYSHDLAQEAIVSKRAWFAVYSAVTI